ncbi:MAG: hypothetical protein ACOX88_09635 [Christensenellales bacterium]|jgi:uncharacterized membrane-anchored protein YhcB (DUF1043 family)
MTVELTVLISIVGTLVGAIVGIFGYRRNANKDTESRAKAEAKMQAEMEYIKANVENIKSVQVLQTSATIEIKERLSRLEAIAKQSDYRLEFLEKCKKTKD